MRVRVMEARQVCPSGPTRHLSIAGLENVRIGTSVGSEQSVPEEVDHREIAVCVQVVDEVTLLLAPEPSETREFRSCDMVFLVKIYVRIERRRTCKGHYDEQIERKNKKHPTGDEERGDDKVGRVVAFLATIRRGHEMALGVVSMMEFDVVPVEGAAYPVMAEAVMEQSLAARYDQMSTDGSENEKRKLRQAPSQPSDHRQWNSPHWAIASVTHPPARRRIAMSHSAQHMPVGLLVKRGSAASYGDR